MLKLPFPHTNGTIIVNKSLPSSSIQVLTTVSRTEECLNYSMVTSAKLNLVGSP